MRMRRQCLGMTLAVVLSLFSGRLLAAPAECLRYPDNPSIAACANQYSPGSPVPGPRPTPLAQPRTQSVPVGPDTELRTVAVVVGGKATPQPAPVPEGPMFEVDRAALTNTIIAGAVAGSLLILVAIGFWRWGSTLTKACPYCGTKMNRSAQACRRCFRAV